MTTPQDPFAAPDEGGASSQGPGQAPAYGEPPAYGQPPAQGTPPGYGAQPGFGTPAYGTQPYGQAPVTGWQGPPLAAWGTRFGGYLIDFLLSLAAQTVVGLVDRGVGQLVGIAVFLYFGYLTGTTGQTPGRRIVGVKILREADGQVLGAGAGIGRGFLHFLDALPLLLGFFWPLWDAKNQTFADKIIKSVAIKV